jgi:hypothetical protein
VLESIYIGMNILLTESQLTKLKHILKEEDQPMDDMVDFDQINLQYEYAKLNDMLFNGELPKVPMMWDKTKTAHGRLKKWTRRDTGKVVKMEMMVSRFYDVPYKVFRNTLAHEMIHVFQAINDIEEGDGNHGQVFHREMNRINGMGLGFNVSVKLDITKLDLKVSGSVKAVRLVAVVLTFNDNEKVLSILTPNCYQNDMIHLANIFEYSIRKGEYTKVEASIFDTQIPSLRRLKANSSIKKTISWVRAPQDMINMVMNEGSLINHFVITKDNTDWTHPPKVPQQQNSFSLADLGFNF